MTPVLNVATMSPTLSPADRHGALVRQLIDLDWDREADARLAPSIVEELHLLINDRIPISFEAVMGYPSDIPEAAIIAANNRNAIAKLGVMEPGPLGQNGLRKLLVAYGRAGYFEADSRDVRLFSKRNNGTLLEQAIILACIPMALACIDLGAKTELIPSSPIPGVDDFASFLVNRLGADSPLFAEVMEAVLDRRIAQAASEAPQVSPGADPDGAEALAAAAPMQRRRRAGL